MNAQRRKQIRTIIDSLKAHQEAIGAHHEELTILRDEEQAAYEAMPDGLKQTPTGEASEQAGQDLDDAATGSQDVVHQLDAALEILEQAIVEVEDAADRAEEATGG